MTSDKIEKLIRHLESYVEVWKQFNRYLVKARAKKFTPEDEERFLEVKSLLTQELELLLSELDSRSPTRQEVHDLIAGTSSLRFLSEAHDDTLRVAENQWHRMYIAWQAILGQLKVKQREAGGATKARHWFGGR